MAVNISACRRIENWIDVRWDSNQLPTGVAQWTKDRLAKIQGVHDPELDTLITAVTFNLHSPSSPSALKCNLLAFLEDLAAHDASAQQLVNTPLTSSLVQLLDQDGSMLRMRAATVLGILIRFATAIQVDMLLPGEARGSVCLAYTNISCLFMLCFRVHACRKH